MHLRWVVSCPYFVNFGDRYLKEWLEDKSNSDKLRAVGNAFLRRWGAFKRGRISYDEFLAVLKATELGTWKWDSVKKRCPNEENPNKLFYEGFSRNDYT